MIQLNFAKPAAIKLGDDYLTDHNRAPISIEFERLENRVRTQLGRMRKYFRADKRSFSVSWTSLPHDSDHTVDAELGAEDMRDLYQSSHEPMTLTLTYDNGITDTYEVIIDEFSMQLTSRLGTRRMYDVNLSLEEV
jgi:hypothetical protein